MAAGSMSSRRSERPSMRASDGMSGRGGGLKSTRSMRASERERRTGRSARSMGSEGSGATTPSGAVGTVRSGAAAVHSAVQSSKVAQATGLADLLKMRERKTDGDEERGLMELLEDEKMSMSDLTRLKDAYEKRGRWKHRGPRRLRKWERIVDAEGDELLKRAEAAELAEDREIAARLAWVPDGTDVERGPDGRPLGLCTWKSFDAGGTVFVCNNRRVRNKNTGNLMSTCGFHSKTCMDDHPGMAPDISHPNELGVCSTHFLARTGKQPRRYKSLRDVPGVEAVEKPSAANPMRPKWTIEEEEEELGLLEPDSSEEDDDDGELGEDEILKKLREEEEDVFDRAFLQYRQRRIADGKPDKEALRVILWIQSMYRMRAMRRVYFVMLRDKEVQARVRAAKFLQHAYRSKREGEMARAEARARRVAALIIQRNWRNLKFLQGVERKRIERRAAIKIQRWYRRRHLMRTFHTMRLRLKARVHGLARAQARIMMTRLITGWLGRRRVRKLRIQAFRESVAAARIQAVYRDYVVYKTRFTEWAAARDRKEEEKAARVIQGEWYKYQKRGMSRRWIRHRVDNIVRIQALVRGYLARKEADRRADLRESVWQWLGTSQPRSAVLAYVGGGVPKYERMFDLSFITKPRPRSATVDLVPLPSTDDDDGALVASSSRGPQAMGASTTSSAAGMGSGYGAPPPMARRSLADASTVSARTGESSPTESPPDSGRIEGVLTEEEEIQVVAKLLRKSFQRPDAGNRGGTGSCPPQAFRRVVEAFGLAPRDAATCARHFHVTETDMTSWERFVLAYEESRLPVRVMDRIREEALVKGQFTREVARKSYTRAAARGSLGPGDVPPDLLDSGGVVSEGTGDAMAGTVAPMKRAWGGQKLTSGGTGLASRYKVVDASGKVPETEALVSIPGGLGRVVVVPEAAMDPSRPLSSMRLKDLQAQRGVMEAYLHLSERASRRMLEKTEKDIALERKGLPTSADLRAADRVRRLSAVIRAPHSTADDLRLVHGDDGPSLAGGRPPRSRRWSAVEQRRKRPGGEAGLVDPEWYVEALEGAVEGIPLTRETGALPPPSVMTSGVKGSKARRAGKKREEEGEGGVIGEARVVASVAEAQKQVSRGPGRGDLVDAPKLPVEGSGRYVLDKAPLGRKRAEDGKRFVPQEEKDLPTRTRGIGVVEPVLRVAPSGKLQVTPKVSKLYCELLLTLAAPHAMGIRDPIFPEGGEDAAEGKDGSDLSAELNDLVRILSSNHALFQMQWRRIVGDIRRGSLSDVVQVPARRRARVNALLPEGGDPDRADRLEDVLRSLGFHARETLRRSVALAESLGDLDAAGRVPRRPALLPNPPTLAESRAASALTRETPASHLVVDRSLRGVDADAEVAVIKRGPGLLKALDGITHRRAEVAAAKEREAGRGGRAPLQLPIGDAVLTVAGIKQPLHGAVPISLDTAVTRAVRADEALHGGGDDGFVDEGAKTPIRLPPLSPGASPGLGKDPGVVVFSPDAAQSPVERRHTSDARMAQRAAEFLASGQEAEAYALRRSLGATGRAAQAARTAMGGVERVPRARPPLAATGTFLLEPARGERALPSHVEAFSGNGGPGMDLRPELKRVGEGKVVWDGDVVAESQIFQPAEPTAEFPRTAMAWVGRQLLVPPATAPAGVRLPGCARHQWIYPSDSCPDCIAYRALQLPQPPVRFYPALRMGRTTPGAELNVHFRSPPLHPELQTAHRRRGPRSGRTWDVALLAGAGPDIVPLAVYVVCCDRNGAVWILGTRLWFAHELAPVWAKFRGAGMRPGQVVHGKHLLYVRVTDVNVVGQGFLMQTGDLTAFRSAVARAPVPEPNCFFFQDTVSERVEQHLFELADRAGTLGGVSIRPGGGFHGLHAPAASTSVDEDDGREQWEDEVERLAGSKAHSSGDHMLPASGPIMVDGETTRRDEGEGGGGITARSGRRSRVAPPRSEEGKWTSRTATTQGANPLAAPVAGGRTSRISRTSRTSSHAAPRHHQPHTHRTSGSGGPRYHPASHGPPPPSAGTMTSDEGGVDLGFRPSTGGGGGGPLPSESHLASRPSRQRDMFPPPPLDSSRRSDSRSDLRSPTSRGFSGRDTAETMHRAASARDLAQMYIPHEDVGPSAAFIAGGHYAADTSEAALAHLHANLRHRRGTPASSRN